MRFDRPLLIPFGTARAAVAAPASDAPVDLFASLCRARADEGARAELHEETLAIAWELARFSAPSDDVRAHTALFALVLDALSRGSTRLSIAEREPLRARAEDLGLAPPDRRRVLALASALSSPLEPRAQLGLFASSDTGARSIAIGAPGERRPFVLEGGMLATERMHALERDLADRIRARAVPAELATREARVQAVEEVAHAPLRLTDEQRAAVHAPLTRALSVITGGPGTGKTSIVIALLRALARLGIAPSLIALAAPTGKAADRMTRSVSRVLTTIETTHDADRALASTLRPAETLHRLLRYRPDERRFDRHPGSPLAERVVIVDEASMLDTWLAERLFAALGPDARVVLLGDADQLPSVEPGAVLRDLVATPAIAPSLLTRSHRMSEDDPAGAHVLGIARAIDAGRPPGTSEAPLTAGALTVLRELPGHVGSLRGASILPATRLADRAHFLAWWMDHAVRADAEIVRLSERTWHAREGHLVDVEAAERLFVHLESHRLLCITHGRDTGVDRVNDTLAALLAKRRGVALAPNVLSIGEPVLITENDHERRLWNGDQGIVLWCQPEGSVRRPTAVFRRGAGFACFSLDAVRGGLARAFAVTVHKAQGSEHDAIALVLPDEDVPRLWTREIVYTAITRARRSALLVGDVSLLGTACARANDRVTGLRSQLAAIGRAASPD